MAAIARILEANVVQTTKRHTATIFFFHGSGGTAEELKEWVDSINGKKLQFPHIKLIYPSAPSQPYTPNDGMMQNIWFDRKAISNQASECVESIDSMCQSVLELIEKEVASGIPYNRIILGGFSMGGSLAMHLAYRYKPSLAGCFAFSSFVNKESVIYKHLKANPEYNKVPLLQFHGDTDTLIPFEWGEESSKNLFKLGVDVTFIPVLDCGHELHPSEIYKWKNSWLLKLLPEK